MADTPNLHTPRLQRPRLASPVPSSQSLLLQPNGGGGGARAGVVAPESSAGSSSSTVSRSKSPRLPLNLSIPAGDKTRRFPSSERLRLETGDGTGLARSSNTVGLSSLTDDLQRAILSDDPSHFLAGSTGRQQQARSGVPSRELTPPSAGSTASSGGGSAILGALTSIDDGAGAMRDIGPLVPEDIESLARLGEGAGGEVYRVRHRPSGLIMAKKTIPTSPQIHRQLLREISFLRSTSSNYVIRYYGALLAAPDDGSLISIFMEYAEGGSLEGIYRTVKRRGGRTGEKVLGKIALGVLNGLEYLHERKIIHRDIKPSNILVTRQGQIKLCDFGVSGELVNSIAGTFTGTSYYMAPERIQGRPYTINSDVWSLGLTIMEVALDRFPFPEPGEPPLGPIDLLSYVVHKGIPGLQTAEKTGRSEDEQIKWSFGICDFLRISLDRDSVQRPHPIELLRHPWIVKSQNRKVDMARWIQEVWEWPS